MSEEKDACATFCMIMSAVAVPFLAYLGYLCSQKSHLVQLPQDSKADAAWGCYGSAAIYAVAFCYSVYWKSKGAVQGSARNASMVEMRMVTESGSGSSAPR